MKIVNIYQTIEDRGDDDSIEKHGPFFCSQKKNGRNKTGIREPWLGEGYYFWDTRISDAVWWGQETYWKTFRGYAVCETKYDQHSPLLFDLVWRHTSLR